MPEVKIPKPGEREEKKEAEVEPEETEDYSREIEGVKSDISGLSTEVKSDVSALRTEIKDLSGRVSKLAEVKGVKEVLSECPECYRVVKPEDMGKHLRPELEPKIRGELEPKIREELEPKIRDELEGKLKPEKEIKEVPKLIPQSEFRKTITYRLGEYRKDEVDKLKPGVFEVEKILLDSGLIESEDKE